MQAQLLSFSLAEWNHWYPVLQTGGYVLLTLILSWIAYHFAHRLINRFRVFMALKITSDEETKRIQTLSRVFHYIASVVIVLMGGMLVLSQIGFSIAPILGAAGVVGVVVGFGAQSLVKDCFIGLFLLLENQIRQGDVIEVAGKSGEVEEMTLRYTRLRDFDGSVHFVPNGLITTVTNRTRDYAYAPIDINIAYKEDIDHALHIMRDVGQEIRNTADLGPNILEDMEIWGVDKLGDSGVALRGRFKTLPLAQWDVRREFLKRIKLAFDKSSIEIPFPHMKIYAGHNKDSSTSPFRVVATPKAD